jgi:putative transposase
VVAFIDDNRDEHGVEPICRVLQMAPSTYYAAKKREVEPSARTMSDAVWMPILMAIWVANRKVMGCTSCGRPLGVRAMSSVGIGWAV